MKQQGERTRKAFIDGQRRRLVKTARRVGGRNEAKEAEEKEVNSQSSGQAEEYEDDARGLTTLELDGNSGRLATCSDSHRSTGHWKRSGRQPWAFRRQQPTYTRKDSKPGHRRSIYTVAEQATVNRRGYEVPVKKSKGAERKRSR